MHEKKVTKTQKKTCVTARLCYTVTMNENDINRIEDLSPADLQDYLDWLEGIQK